MEQITVRISNTGEIEYDVKGVKGGKCKDLTKAIDAIAGKVLESKVTGEFCQTEVRQQLKTGN